MGWGRARHTAFCCALLLLVRTAAAQQPCAADCDGDDTPTEADVAAATRAVFDRFACAHADLDANRRVTAAELLRIRLAVVDPRRSCWVPLPPLPAGPRQEIAVARLGDVVYVIGGLTDTGQGSAAVETFNTRTHTWGRAGDLPRPLHHVGAAVAGGLVFAVGGFVRQTFTPATDVSCYEESEGRWIAVAPLPAARGALAVAELDGLIYAVGGSGPAGSVTTHTVYDHGLDRWTIRAPLPSPRNHLAAVGLDGFLYVIGGRSDGGGNANSAALDRYDPAGDRWDALEPMPTARSGHAAAVLGGRIVVIGGEVDPADPFGVFDDVEIYDPATDTWEALEGMDVPRHGIGAVTTGDLVYVPGGATRAGFAATADSDALILP